MLRLGFVALVGLAFCSCALAFDAFQANFYSFRPLFTAFFRVFLFQIKLAFVPNGMCVSFATVANLSSAPTVQYGRDPSHLDRSAQVFIIVFFSLFVRFRVFGCCAVRFNVVLCVCACVQGRSHTYGTIFFHDVVLNGLDAKADYYYQIVGYVFVPFVCVMCMFVSVSVSVSISVSFCRSVSNVSFCTCSSDS